MSGRAASTEIASKIRCDPDPPTTAFALERSFAAFGDVWDVIGRIADHTWIHAVDVGQPNGAALTAGARLQVSAAGV